MAGASIKILRRGIQEQLEGMIKRANLVPGYLNRVIPKEYKIAQKLRWDTENKHQYFEGSKSWDPLSFNYSERKRKMYAGFPYEGTRMMFATGHLYRTVMNPNKIVEDKKIRLFIDTGLAAARPNPKTKKKGKPTSAPKGKSYFEYADEARTYTTWGAPFMTKIRRDLALYVNKGISRSAF